jgi:hypothetical protein
LRRLRDSYERLAGRQRIWVLLLALVILSTTCLYCLGFASLIWRWQTRAPLPNRQPVYTATATPFVPPTLVPLVSPTPTRSPPATALPAQTRAATRTTVPSLAPSATGVPSATIIPSPTASPTETPTSTATATEVATATSVPPTPTATSTATQAPTELPAATTQPSSTSEAAETPALPEPTHTSQPIEPSPTTEAPQGQDCATRLAGQSIGSDPAEAGRSTSLAHLAVSWDVSGLTAIRDGL